MYLSSLLFCRLLIVILFLCAFLTAFISSLCFGGNLRLLLSLLGLICCNTVCFIVVDRGFRLTVHLSLDLGGLVILLLMLSSHVLLAIVTNMVCRYLHSWLLVIHAFLHELLWLTHVVLIPTVHIILTLISLIAIHVHLVIFHLALDRCEITRWSTHPQRLILVLLLLKLHLILLNRHIH